MRSNERGKGPIVRTAEQTKSFNQYKATAANVADMAIDYGVREAAQAVMFHRTGYAHRAAVVAALSACALMDRGKPELAEELIREIGKRGLIL